MNDWCCMGKIGGKVADEQKAYWSSFGESMANIGKPTGTGNGFFGRRSAQPTARAVLDRRDVTTILEGFECTGFAIPFSASDYDAQVSSFLAGNKPAGSASATASSSSAASSSNASSSGTTSAPSSAAAVATSNGSGSAKLAATSSKSTSSSKAAAAVMTQAPILGFGTVAAVAAVAAVYGAM